MSSADEIYGPVDPLTPHRMDMQIKTLRTVANNIEARMYAENRRENETRDVEWTSEHGLRIIHRPGDETLPILSVIYSSDDYIVARRAGYMYVFEVIVREMGGAAQRVRKLFVFDPDARA